MTRRKPLRVGAGAGTSDDRLVPALDLAERAAALIVAEGR